MSHAPMHCEYCGKRLKIKKGPGRPKRFCSEICGQRRWQQLNPRRKVAAD